LRRLLAGASRRLMESLPLHDLILLKDLCFGYGYSISLGADDALDLAFLGPSLAALPAAA